MVLSLLESLDALSIAFQVPIHMQTLMIHKLQSKFLHDYFNITTKYRFV